jgi:methionine-rich copper-binding protein CopC
MPADSTIQRLASFAKNSKAHDDSFTDLNGRNSYILDVLKNDQGEQSKILWSLDEGSGVSNEPADLLSRDDISSINSSQLGAQISITQDGKVAYAITPELQAKLNDLLIGESLTDTFIYAMQQGQGDSPLNWAKATVTLSGLNHAPELTGTTAILANGTQNTDYKILASDLLQGFTDADNDSLSIINLTATHGLLTETAGGWVLTPEESYASDIQLNYDVTDGHGGSVSATQQFTLEPSNSDNTPPSLISTEPFDDFDAYAVNNNIVLRFDETVAPGTGNIIVSNGTDTRIIAADDSSQVMFSGSKVTINPSSNLVPNTTYHVEMASGVITDLSGNPFAGIGNPPAGSTDLSTFNFTTSADTSAPQVIWSQPAEGQPFKIDGDITIGFNEEIAAGTGNIVISNGSDTRTIALNDASQVTIGKYFNTGAVNNGFITINPAEDLILDSTYRIEIISGAITDTSGNAWGGFSDILSFSTISSNPRLSWSNPLDESTDFQADNNIELFFDEAVKPGSSGNIIISNGTDTRTIAIHDANQVTFTDYGSVTVNPSADLIPGTYYHIKIDSGAITDLAGNPYAGISDETTINFSTISSEPWLYWSSPQDDSADFQVDHNIELYFNEGVQAGSNGNIVISNGSDIRTIAIHDTSQVTFTDYGSVVINPSADLISGTSYHIKVDSGAITDAAGNAYAGINDETTLNFSTISSTPLLYWSYPLDDSTDLQIDRNIELYFNETIQPGSSGNIVISNGSDTRTIAINDTSQVIFDGFGGVSINPSADLIPNTHYSIKIDSGAITDLAGNAYAGINDDTTLNFSTIPSDPLLSSSTPADDSTNFQVDQDIVLNFNETVQAGGSGNIVISNGSDTRIIAAADTSQVTFNGGKVTINPTANLIPNTGYSIRIDSGAIIDSIGNVYAGINDDTALNFFTVSSEPQLLWTDPWDGTQDFPVDANIELSFNEAIRAGSSGNIVISNGSDTRTIAISDASQVSFDGYRGTIINPSDDLIPGTHYHIKIDNGAITDLAGNAYAGINDKSTLDFSTVTTEPRITWSSPWDGFTDFQADRNIELYFNQVVKPGASGNIVISNGTDTRTIAINDVSQVTFDGYRTVTINPLTDLVPGTHYHIKIDSGAITDEDGNAYAGISDDRALDFFISTTEPRLTGSNPSDDSTSFQVDHNIELYFNEWVQAGATGNIVISNGSDTRTIATNDSSQVTFHSYGGVSINPSADLIPDTHYHIKIDNGAITDLDGNAYAGIGDDTTLDFSTITTEPLLSWSDPMDNTTAFQTDHDIKLFFNEEIQAGNGGNIVISNGSDTRTIAIHDSSQVTFSGSKVTINPTTDLIPNTNYSIRIDNGAITDIAGNAYAGINDDATLNFSTVTSEPRLTGSTPWDNSIDFQVDHNIELYFDEEIQAGNSGSGNIIISNGADTRTIAIHDASQVIFNGSMMTINPSADLIPFTHYSIQIDNGAITDLAGNTYAGINDNTTLNFSTVATEPQLSWSSPYDEKPDFPVDGDIELFFNESVQAGSNGNIVISNGTDTRTIAIDDTSQVSFSGYNRVAINPLDDLIPYTSYSIRIDSAAITDLTGNTYAGISDDTTLNFSTVTTEPRLSWSNPWDGYTDFLIDQNISLAFNQAIKQGASGNIIVSNGSDTRVIAINDASQVAFDGYNGVTINPTADLIPNTHYNIKIDSGAITDLEGNAYAGINDDTTLDFFTISSEPRLSWSNPWDDYTGFQIDQNIELFFNEWVHAGSTGNIIITSGSDTRTIAANDSSQVTFNGSKVTINPAMDLVPNTGYSILIDNGAITDEDGNAYAGISDDTALNFTTAADDGTLLASPVIVGSPGLITPDIAGSHFPII